ncbi:MAG: hypothetical protein SVR94_07490 [Pseudomonadota bacterium]|nr:hypothetical protein [Pseudomonadota bacterium]
MNAVFDSDDNLRVQFRLWLIPVGFMNVVMSPEQAQSLVYKNLKYIDNLAKKRFAKDSPLAVDYVLTQLAQNEWQPIISYQQGDFKLFLTVVVTRLWNEFEQDPKTLFYRHLDYLKTLAYRFFRADKQLAEQAIDYMLFHLEKNNWQQVRKYQGKGFTAFIKKVAENLFKDFAKKGKLATVAFEEEQLETQDPTPALPEQLNQQALHSLFFFIHQLQTEPSAAEQTVHQWSKKLTDYLQTTQKRTPLLTHEDYLLLYMIYQDELSVSEAGRRLHLNENQVQGRHRRLLARLNDIFNHCGLTAEFKSLLEDES